VSLFSFYSKIFHSTSPRRHDSTIWVSSVSISPAHSVVSLQAHKHSKSIESSRMLSNTNVRQGLTTNSQQPTTTTSSMSVYLSVCLTKEIFFLFRNSNTRFPLRIKRVVCKVALAACSYRLALPSIFFNRSLRACPSVDYPSEWSAKTFFFFFLIISFNSSQQASKQMDRSIMLMKIIT
jgi:hypothetical protein